jgi:hypothetical protein
MLQEPGYDRPAVGRRSRRDTDHLHGRQMLPKGYPWPLAANNAAANVSPASKRCSPASRSKPHLHLMDMAWHDCYCPRELEVPPAVLDDVLLLSDGDLAVLIRVAREAVIDFRDVRIAADTNRAKSK